jgi:hypothetical protein
MHKWMRRTAELRDGCNAYCIAAVARVSLACGTANCAFSCFTERCTARFEATELLDHRERQPNPRKKGCIERAALCNGVRQYGNRGYRIGWTKTLQSGFEALAAQLAAEATAKLTAQLAVQLSAQKPLEAGSNMSLPQNLRKTSGGAMCE